MNTVERIKLVKAMEYVARQINDENVFYAWLTDGVADGDFDYGDLDVKPDDDDYYASDDAFASVMGAFLWCMAKANESGGLYCDGVVSK